MHIWKFLFQNIVCKIRDVIYRISLFSTWRLCASDAKTKIRQRDWLKLAGEKIRANKFAKWKIGLMLTGRLHE